MDYSLQSDADLLECYGNVDKEAYPENYRLILGEIARRGLLSEPGQAVAAHEKPKVLSRPNYSAEEILALIRGEDKKTFNPLYLFFISLLFFSFAGAFSSDRKYILMAVPALFLHECGHLLAMRVFKYKNTRILFIPFLGALTSGTPGGFSRSKETLISLAGPVFGVLTGVVFLVAFRFLRHDFWLQSAAFTFILNGLNLLPIAPLDGGRVVETLITSRHPALDIGYRVLSIVMFIAGAIRFQDYALGVMAYFSAILIWSAISEYRAIRSIRRSGGLKDGELGLENVSTIYEAIQSNFAASHVPRMKAKTIAQVVNRIFQSLRMAPAGWATTTGLLLGYAVAFCTALVFLVGSVMLKRKLGIP